MAETQTWKTGRDRPSLPWGRSQKENRKFRSPPPSTILSCGGCPMYNPLVVQGQKTTGFCSVRVIGRRDGKTKQTVHKHPNAAASTSFLAVMRDSSWSGMGAWVLLPLTHLFPQSSAANCGTARQREKYKGVTKQVDIFPVQRFGARAHQHK